MSAEDVEETLRRIASHRGVEGVLICNSAGTVLRTTMAATATARYAALLSRLVDAARGAVRGADAENDLVFLRLRSLKNEIMVVPDKEFVLVVIQGAQVDEDA